MLDKEDALDNLADYTKIRRIKLMLSKIHELRKLAHSGNQTAHCIAIDLQNALESEKLTKKQRYALEQRFIMKETNTYIADQMKITESAVRKHLEGGLIRLRKILNGW